MFAGLNILSVSCLCTATGITRGLQKWCCISSSKTQLLCLHVFGKIVEHTKIVLSFKKLQNLRLDYNASWIPHFLQVPNLLWILWASHDWSNLSDAFQHVLYFMDSGKTALITPIRECNPIIFSSSLLACLTMTPRLTSCHLGPVCIMLAPREHFTGTGASGSTFSRLCMCPWWCSS